MKQKIEGGTNTMEGKKKLPSASNLHMFLLMTVAGLTMNPNPTMKNLGEELAKMYQERFKQSL